MVKNLTNNHTRLFWETYHRRASRENIDLVDSTLNKCDAYPQEGIAHILSQERSSFDFRSIIDSNKVLLMLLSPQLEEMSRLIGSRVIAKLLMAAFSRADTPLHQCMVSGRSDLPISPLALFILGGAVDDGVTCVFGRICAIQNTASMALPLE